MNDTSKRAHDDAKCYKDLGTMADSVKMEKIIAYREMRDLADAEYHRYLEIEDLENAQIFKNYSDIFTRKILQLFRELGTVPQSRYEQRSLYGRDANTGRMSTLMIIDEKVEYDPLKIDKEVEYDPIQKTCVKKGSGVRCDIDGDFSRPWKY